jgi:hypothetical protein
MVAIGFRDKDEYFRRDSQRHADAPQHAGPLRSFTNRVFLFDETAGKSKANWSENAVTIIHEATHQTAFNVGVHRRFAAEPRWLVEGLATMFKPPAFERDTTTRRPTA